MGAYLNVNEDKDIGGFVAKGQLPPPERGKIRCMMPAASMLLTTSRTMMRL